MLRYEITDNSALDAFNRLIALGHDPSGVLNGIGEVIIDFTKRRFELSQDPYGNPWAPNSDTTLRKMLHDHSGTFTNKGKVSAKGTAMLAGKKPLIGESKDLSTQFHSTVDQHSVVVSSLMIYAAMMHFGGNKSEFPNLWGDIPARGIFPDEALGLPDELQRGSIEVLQTALENAIRG